jgi:hypothetical protein
MPGGQSSSKIKTSSKIFPKVRNNTLQNPAKSLQRKLYNKRLRVTISSEPFKAFPSVNSEEKAIKAGKIEKQVYSREVFRRNK